MKFDNYEIRQPCIKFGNYEIRQPCMKFGNYEIDIEKWYWILRSGVAKKAKKNKKCVFCGFFLVRGVGG